MTSDPSTGPRFGEPGDAELSALRPEPPLFTAPVDGARVVAAAATSRKRRRAAVVASSASAVVGVALVLLSSQGGFTTLRPAPPVAVGASDSPQPGESGRPGEGTPAPTEPGQPSQQPSAGSSDGAGDPGAGGEGPGAGSGGQPEPSASDDYYGFPPPNDDPDEGQPTSSASPSPSVSPTPRPIDTTPSDDVARPVTRSTRSKGAADCESRGGVTSGAWCVDYSGDGESDYGSSATLSVEACRVSGTGAGTLHFGSGREVDFDLDDDAGNSWLWSSHVDSDGGAHDLQVPSGTCVVWTTVWPGRDNDGLLMPAGYYSLVTPVLADNVYGPSNSASDYAIGFTVVDPQQQ